MPNVAFTRALNYFVADPIPVVGPARLVVVV